MDLKKLLQEKRPHASIATIRTYCSLLRGLFYKAHEKSAEFSPNWFKSDVKKVLELLAEKSKPSRKTNLAAIVVLLDGKAPEEYIQMMNKDADDVKSEYKEQKKSAKQEENWLAYGEVRNVWDTQYKKIKHLLLHGVSPDANELKELVKFMVLTLTCGIYFPPRRSEWVSMRVAGYDKAKDNYIDMKKSEFVFNKYKTAKSHGEERVPFPKEFKTLLNKYLKKIGNREYLIFNTKGGELSNTALTQMLNAIFDKKISTSMLRHIYLTNKYEGLPKIKELEETAASLGHSVGQMLEYVKH